jgi:hypothetical protein
MGEREAQGQKKIKRFARIIMMLERIASFIYLFIATAKYCKI